MFIIQTHRKKCRKPSWRLLSIKGEDGQRSPMIKMIVVDCHDNRLPRIMAISNWSSLWPFVNRHGDWLIMITIGCWRSRCSPNDSDVQNCRSQMIKMIDHRRSKRFEANDQDDSEPMIKMINHQSIMIGHQWLILKSTLSLITTNKRLKWIFF